LASQKNHLLLISCQKHINFLKSKNLGGIVKIRSTPRLDILHNSLPLINMLLSLVEMLLRANIWTRWYESSRIYISYQIIWYRDVLNYFQYFLSINHPLLLEEWNESKPKLHNEQIRCNKIWFQHVIVKRNTMLYFKSWPHELRNVWFMPKFVMIVFL
jgi:hypothetical protein